MSKNATRVKRNWKDLTQASELQSDTLEHSFDVSFNPSAMMCTSERPLVKLAETEG